MCVLRCITVLRADMTNRSHHISHCIYSRHCQILLLCLWQTLLIIHSILSVAHLVDIANQPQSFGAALFPGSQATTL